MVTTCPFGCIKGITRLEFIEGMIHKFLNATTFDGYNPYRVTKDGFDWETIEENLYVSEQNYNFFYLIILMKTVSI